MGAPAPAPPARPPNHQPPPSSSPSPHPRPTPRSPTSSSASLTSEASEASSDHSPTRSSPSTPSPPPLHASLHQNRLPPPPPIPTPPGLFNLGNTCYLNSVVQVLYHLPTFRTALLRYHPLHHQHSHLDHFACELACSLRAVFLSLDDAYAAAARHRSHHDHVFDRPPVQHDSLTPTANDPNAPDDLMLRENIDYVAPQQIINLLRDHDRCHEFDARGQQDAHEFLRFLLDKVNDCMQMDKEDQQFHFHPPHIHLNSCTYPPVPPDVPPLQNHTATSAPNASSSTAAMSPSPPQYNHTPHPPGNDDLHCKHPDDTPGHGVQAPILANTADETSAGELDATIPAKQKAIPPHTETKTTLTSVPKSSKPTSEENHSECDEAAQKSPATKRRRCEMESPPENGQQQQNGPVSTQPGERASPMKSKTTAEACNSELPLVNGSVAKAKLSPSASRNRSERQPAKRYRRNLVPDLFQGRAVTATRCYECESQSQRSEMFLDVSLPVEHGKSLSWALSTQCAEEQLLDTNKYYCNNCKTYTEAKRWWQVASLPEVLTVHLKLFAYGSRLTGAGGKVSVAMPCPIRTKLAEWCDTECAECDDEYALTAVIVHEGTGASSGHYYSYICKPDQDQQWYCCDDSFVTAVSEDEVKQRLFTSMKTKRTAYLLFYSNAHDLRLQAP